MSATSRSLTSPHDAARDAPAYNGGVIHHPTDCDCAAHHKARRAPTRARPHTEDTTLGARPATAALRRRLLTRFANAYATWQRTVAGIPDGDRVALRAAEDAMNRAFHSAIDATWADAYRVGFGSRASGTVPGMPPSFLGDIDRQRRFATSFAQDIAAGNVGKNGRMAFGQRAALYANGVEGAFNAGAINAGGDGELIFWRLGSADHCFSCPLIAASSPYTRDSLPTYPRSGATPCGNNCKCHLEFMPTAGRRVTPPDPTTPDAVLEPPSPPEGMRRPTPAEEAGVREAEARARFAARKAAEARRLVDREKWVARKRSAETALDELVTDRRLWIPRGIPPEPIVTGRSIGEPQIMDLVRTRGIDGPTVARSGADVGKATKGALASLAGLMAALGAFGAGFVATVEPDDAEGDAEDGTLLREAVTVDGGARVLVSVVGDGLEATLRNHLEALQVLAAGGHAVEVGPYGARWPELVAALGTWVVGERAEVDSFLTAWGKSAYGRGGLAVAPWRERA